VILPDVNILVHAYNADFPGHAAAKRWWEQSLSSQTTAIGLSWVVILGFLRLTTSRQVFPRPLSAKEATSIIESWLAQPGVRIASPGEEHAVTLFRLVEGLGTAANLTTDAHLAALALEYRAEVATTDTDFARFPGVRHFNPLATRGKRN
jgi:uncharacterized protein